MRAVRVQILNFRGIQKATLLLPKHGVLIGDNNTGKTTILEALDLVLGPDRLNRYPPVNEHDFFRGSYTAVPEPLPEDGAEIAEIEGGLENEPDPDANDADPKPAAPKVEIDVTIIDLTEEQRGVFADYIEFWDAATDSIYNIPNPEGVDAEAITEALRVSFHGWYDPEEDDFEGKTYFTRSFGESDKPEQFNKRHKRVCGFLYLRSLRTGSRALSLERGSLLDIILRLKEVRPQMWEDTISTLSAVAVASDPDLGISPILNSINEALKRYVPREWGVEPHLKVSNLTREHLRKVVTAFIATGEGDHSAPFYRQGTGTINMLVLAMLSQIAEDRQNIIFAMEEPETAIPPYAQKRIVHEVSRLASQTLFTSHSPYVLEEFEVENTAVLKRDEEGILERQIIDLPENIKPKRYRQEFRTRFCEGLLARRILVAEGSTEASAFPVVCRRLSEMKPDEYSSLEALGICTVDAGSESNIPGMAKLYRELGKCTYALCDKQEEANQALIEEQVELLLMHPEKGFEDLVLKGTNARAILRFVERIDWPEHLIALYPDPAADAEAALADYFKWSKGNWGVADFLAQCSEDEIPEWLRIAAIDLKAACTADPEDKGEVPMPADAGLQPEAAADEAD